jgi:MinD-like ATPase involved in chromosome partitioning or flagellar assembly
LFKKLRLYSRAQIQSRLRTPVLLGIPEDPSVMEAATLMRPVISYKPKSAVAKAFWELARKMGG